MFLAFSRIFALLIILTGESYLGSKIVGAFFSNSSESVPVLPVRTESILLMIGLAFNS